MESGIIGGSVQLRLATLPPYAGTAVKLVMRYYGSGSVLIGSEVVEPPVPLEPTEVTVNV